MEVEYERKHRINYTETGQDLELSLVDAFNVVQNVMTEYFETFKSDNIVLKNQNNAIWVLTKTRIHFDKYPQWRDSIISRGYMTKVKPIRIETESQTYTKQKEKLFTARQECCVIDLDTRKIRKINTVNFPENMETENSAIESSYMRLKDEFSEKDFMFEQKVYSSDMDFSRHTNNTIYVKYIANTLTCNFFDENVITDMEIHYINESREGDLLQVYRKFKEKNIIEFLITSGEKEVIRAILKYKRKK